MKFNSRSIFSILLLVLFFGYTFNGMMTYADYYLNKEYIAETLCVNKDNPDMNCEGSCFLEKQLQKENSDQSPVNTSHKSVNEIQLFSEDVPYFSFLYASIALKTERINFYLFPVTNKHITSIFRPPCA